MRAKRQGSWHTRSMPKSGCIVVRAVHIPRQTFASPGHRRRPRALRLRLGDRSRRCV